MSKFKLTVGDRIPKEPEAGIKFSDMQALYDQIRYRDGVIFIGVDSDDVTSQRYMLSTNADGKPEKIVFDVGADGPGLTFTGVKNSFYLQQDHGDALLYVRVNNRIHKVKRLIDSFNIIVMAY